MAQQSRLVWNPLYRDARSALEPYVNVPTLRPNSTADDLTYIREMNRINAVFCFKPDRKSRWTLYCFDGILQQVIGRAGEEKLTIILTALKLTWRDVYTKIDMNRFGDFLARYNPKVEVIALIFDIVNGGIDTHLTPSELLNKHQNLTSSHKAP